MEGSPIGKTDHGLIGGGLSFALLWMAPSIPVAWGCELLGGLLFPLFNARSAAIFQQAAPRERLAQLSAVRLLMLRITMPLGILFGSNMFFTLSTRNAFLTIGLIMEEGKCRVHPIRDGDHDRNRCDRAETGNHPDDGA